MHQVLQLWHHFLHLWADWVLTAQPSALYLGIIVLMALVSFVWRPYDATFVDPAIRLAKPSWEHWFGTDKFGRDVFSQIMVGSRTTLFVGVVAVGVAAVIGVPLGILAAMVRRWPSEFIMRANDLLLAFPALLLAIRHPVGTSELRAFA